MISFACRREASDRMAASVSAIAAAISRASLGMDNRSRRILARMWRWMRGGAPRLLAALCLLASALPARAAEPVAVEIVLALDSSASIDRHEFALQLDGL